MSKTRPQTHSPTEIHSLNAIEHLLTYCPERVLSLSCAVSAPGSKRIDALLELAKEHGISVSVHHKKNPFDEPIKAQIKPFQYADWTKWLETLNNQSKSLVLALDHIQDPQNLGALCRSAEAFGTSGVIIPRDRSAGVTMGAYHASVGAVETVPILQVTNLNESLRKLKKEGFWIVGAALGEQAKSIEETPDFEKCVLVLGTELEGLKHTTLSLCDWIAEIPLQGKVQSLNVSNAGAIFLYEFSRRLLLNK